MTENDAITVGRLGFASACVAVYGKVLPGGQKLGSKSTSNDPSPPVTANQAKGKASDKGQTGGQQHDLGFIADAGVIARRCLELCSVAREVGPRDWGELIGIFLRIGGVEVGK